MNQRLRKTLQPKNAIMVLNEMKAGVQFTFPETQGAMSNSLYLVHAEVTLLLALKQFYASFFIIVFPFQLKF